LEQWAQHLKGITWLKGQGTLEDKAHRLKKLVKSLAAIAGADASAVESAALLAKADLATNMVREKEFNSLQGVMGGLYAVAQNLGDKTARAIGEHYLPRWAGDALPESPEGAVLAVADKLDTICGCFKAGLIPTGSQDPFALRRQGLGVILTVLKHRWDVSLKDLVSKALAGYGPAKSHKLADEIETFLQGRLQTVLEGRNLSYDAVLAALAAGKGSLIQQVERAEAIHRMKPTPEFQQLATAAGRVLRILPPKRKQDRVAKALLKTHEEAALHEAVLSALPDVETAVKEGRWEDAGRELGRLTPSVHAFFEKVLVMDKNPKVRANRLALLGQLGDLYLGLCDFRKLVYAAEGPAQAS